MFNSTKNDEKVNSPKKTFNIFNIFPEETDNSNKKSSPEPDTKPFPQINNPFSSPLSKKIMK